MKTWIKVLIVTLVCAVPAVALGNVIWPIAPGGPAPTAGQLPFFILLEVVTSLTFGLGVAFLIFGMPLVRRVSPDSRLIAWAMYLSIGWSLISWWPHGHLHQHNGENMQGLLYIEYGFHVTLMLSALILAYCFVSVARRWSAVPPSPASREAPLTGDPATSSAN